MRERYNQFYDISRRDRTVIFGGNTWPVDWRTEPPLIHPSIHSNDRKPQKEPHQHLNSPKYTQLPITSNHSQKSAQSTPHEHP